MWTTEEVGAELERGRRAAGLVALHQKVSWEVTTWAVAEMSGRLPLRRYHATTHKERMVTAYEGPSS